MYAPFLFTFNLLLTSIACVFTFDIGILNIHEIVAEATVIVCFAATYTGGEDFLYHVTLCVCTWSG